LEGGIMARKSIIIIGVILLLFGLQSCQSKPEESILKKYVHAIILKDKATMASMAMEPISFDVERWEIVNVSLEKVEPASLPQLNEQEKKLQKEMQDSIGITMDAKGAADDAADELKNARTPAAKKAAQQKKNELQAKYEEIRAKHDQLMRDYNLAKQASIREEETTNFSLGAGDLTNIRDLKGDVRTKEVEVKVQWKSSTRNIKFYLIKYDLKDETLNLPFHGRWVITKIESLS
jgi:hypothetical protein